MKTILCLLSGFMFFAIQTGENRKSTTNPIYVNDLRHSTLVTTTLHDAPTKKTSKLKNLFSCFKQKKSNPIEKLEQTSKQDATVVTETLATTSTTPILHIPYDPELNKKGSVTVTYEENPSELNQNIKMAYQYSYPVDAQQLSKALLPLKKKTLRTELYPYRYNDRIIIINRNDDDISMSSSSSSHASFSSEDFKGNPPQLKMTLSDFRRGDWSELVA